MKRLMIGLIVVVVAAGAVVSLRGQAISVEMVEVTRTTVYEYVAEDAKTRLSKEYIVDMPISGTANRIELNIGDHVEAGQVITTVDTYPLEQEVKQVESLIMQIRAQVVGVDIQKPKSEDIESAKLRINEMKDSREITQKSRSVIEINLEQAKITFDRAKGLLEAGAGSESNYDQAHLNYQGLKQDLQRAQVSEQAAEKALDQAQIALQRLENSIDDNEYLRVAFKAEIKGYQARLAALNDDLKKTKIKAPVSGPVLEKYIEDRRVLRAGEPLLKIGDLTTIEIECDVLSEEISPMNVGNRVMISGKALNRKVIEGRVSRIYPSGFKKISALGVEQQRVRTLITFDNETARLRPGTSVDVEIVTAEVENTLAVPDRALFRDGGEWFVFVMEGGRANLVSVDVGLRNDDWAEIKSGLEEGMTIVSELKNDLKDGARVVRLD
ncbi:MAG: hypothetical protein COA73_17110 [Candidatus Hydrogenedentota bacterium]|nr:MAG: hypothetical protein COA73_17110 [Candidatus Hydrogenedentota bacterium]